MKKLLLATATVAVLAAPAYAEDIKIGIILGFTGPLESITPDMAAGAELAIKEVNESGKLLGGEGTLVPVRADSTCVDSAAGTAAAERLVTSDGVVAIMGPDCSGVTGAVVNNVAVPNGITVISPSATSPALSTIEDNDLFFRTAPSDARQGQVLADILIERGVEEIAVTYTNNDYGKGLADSFQSAYEERGGKVTITVPHEDGKGDYSAEVASLAAAGSDHLAVFGYVDQGGVGVMRSAVDTGAFDVFVLADGMYGESLTDNLGTNINGTFGTVPGSSGDGAANVAGRLEGIANNTSGPYISESYDAAALIALAIQAAGSADKAAIAAKVLEVANAPGEEIQAGELDKALQILADGGEVDYVGASGVELIGPGEAAGSYREYEVKDGKFEDLKIH